MKRILLTLSVLAATAMLAEAQNSITVRPEKTIGEIGMMNGVGGGPAGAINSTLYKNAGVPFARLHDIGSGTEHIVEIMRIFPKFEADENDPASYDFVLTDQYIKNILNTGTKIIWRLGNSHHEPTQIKKYGAWPPKDFAKWARICEHVIRHYNDGWADGFHWNIEYWEIWNEPDGDQRLLTAGERIPESQKDKVGKVKRYEVAPHSWGGTMEQYYEFYSTVFKHLKETHPDIKVGGPANAGFWANEPFIQAMQKEGVKVDFFSWHRYSRNPETLSAEGIMVRELLDRYGWNDVPTILDEWNYQTGWGADDNAYSAEVRKSIKGTAYTAACMCHMQDVGCTDILTYYDWRPMSSYNGANDRQAGVETSTYYVFYNWNKLRQYRNRIKVDFGFKDPEDSMKKDIYAVAAKNDEGKVRMLISRYNDDNNVVAKKVVHVAIPEGCTKAVCTLSDAYHMNTEFPFPIDKDGVKLTLKPNSVVFIQFK